MRAVLADYAAAGRTVVISSHLLSEVEHTCTHVVVMDKGKVVLTGAVEELTASDTVTLIGLSNVGDVGPPAGRCRLAGSGPNLRASCSVSPAICRVRRLWRSWSQPATASSQWTAIASSRRCS